MKECVRTVLSEVVMLFILFDKMKYTRKDNRTDDIKSVQWLKKKIFTATWREREALININGDIT